MSSDPCVQNTVNVKSLGNRSTSFNAGISNQICFPYSSIGSPYSHLNPFWTVCIWENMMLCIAESLAIPFSRMQTCLRWDYSQPHRGAGSSQPRRPCMGFPSPSSQIMPHRVAEPSHPCRPSIRFPSPSSQIMQHRVAESSHPCRPSICFPCPSSQILPHRVAEASHPCRPRIRFRSSSRNTA